MSEILRRTTLACTVNLIIIGMILTIAAVLTPSWQVVNLQEYYLIHEHGLWFDCKRYIRDGYNVIVKRHRTITEPLHCVYKFDYDKYSGTYAFDDDNSPVGEANRHKFYGWHTCTLILLAISLLVSAFSVCVALCSCRYISLTIVLFITTLVTLCFSNVALGVFFFYSHRANNRFIKGIVTTYEQRVGLAFFMQMGASAFYFIAMVISALSTYFAFTAKGGILDRYSVQNSSKTNMTNIGRSMEFEHPVFMENPHKLLSSMYYPSQPQMPTKQDLEFEKAVADSMPDLSHARSYKSDFLPNRIRRKSETCV